MNGTTKDQFSAIAGIAPGSLYGYFSWLLIMTIFIVVVMVIIRSWNDREKNSDWTPLDLFLTVGRALVLALFITAIFQP